MEVLTKTELLLRKKEILEKIREGAIFIHPTDTIYGLSGNALSSTSVAKIRALKQRPDTPLSIWVPSKQWILDNCSIPKEAQQHLTALPGPITLIAKLKNKKALSPAINRGKETIGVRLPNHWLSKVIEELGIPIITTSANKHGQPFMTSLENLDSDIEKGVEFMIYEGPKEGKPSKIVDFTTNSVKER